MNKLEKKSSDLGKLVSMTSAVFSVELGKTLKESGILKDSLGEDVKKGLMAEGLAFFLHLVARKAATAIKGADQLKFLGNVIAVSIGELNAGKLNEAEEVYSFIKGRLVIYDQYSIRPSSADAGQKGTLLWEFARVVCEKIGRPEDIWTTMAVCSLAAPLGKVLTEAKHYRLGFLG